MLYDSLIREEYCEESLADCQDIIKQAKDMSAHALNIIILEYGTKYQTLSSSVFDSISALFKGEKQSYLLFYGPLKLVSLQNIVHSKDCTFYVKIIKMILQESLDAYFKQPCMEVMKKIVHNIYHYYELNKLTSSTNNEVIEDMLQAARVIFPDLVHLHDKTLEFM